MIQTAIPQKPIQGHKTAYLYRTHNPEHTLQENILEHKHTIQGKAIQGKAKDKSTGATYIN